MKYTGAKAESHYDNSHVYCMDCMDALRQTPDTYFDLAVVDPEFGINIGKSARLVTDKGLKAKLWDDKPISMDYFTELYRVSKNQVIWGGNYYPLPANKHCIIWDKMQPEGMSFGMFDYAWTSFDGANKLYRYSVQKESDKVHPTQKPIKLYDWIYSRYLPNGGKVIDTHLGSGSNRIAADKAGNIEFNGFEIDPEYYEAQEKRYKIFKMQKRLF